LDAHISPDQGVRKGKFKAKSEKKEKRKWIRSWRQKKRGKPITGTHGCLSGEKAEAYFAAQEGQESEIGSVCEEERQFLTKKKGEEEKTW